MPSQHTPGPCVPCDEANKHGMRAGTVIRQEPCGCIVKGSGLLPSPWHVHYCATHAAAPEMVALLALVMDDDDTRNGPLGDQYRALLARIKGAE